MNNNLKIKNMNDAELDAVSGGAVVSIAALAAGAAVVGAGVAAFAIGVTIGGALGKALFD